MSAHHPSLIVLQDGGRITVEQRTPSDVHYRYTAPSNRRLWEAYVVGENGKPCELTFKKYNQGNKDGLSVIIKRDQDFGDRGIVQLQKSPSAELTTIHIGYSSTSIFPAGITHTPSTQVQDILNIPTHCHGLIDNFFHPGM